MAKKAPAKRAPRKPAAKPVIDISSLSAEDLQRLLDAMQPPKAPRWYQKINWRPWLVGGAKAAFMVAIGVVGGVWVAGGVPIGPGPIVRNDSLSQAHVADRVSQIAVLRELAEQPFDGTTDEGRRKAGEWFNAQRFRNRADDFGAYTDAVSEAIAANSEADLAKKLEGK